jgi:hypothetical protein
MAIQTAIDSINNSSGSPFGFKNRIINGAMVIDQRNAGASVTANDNVWGVDRFQFAMSQSSKGTSQQSSTAPTGFIKSLLFTSSSAYTVGAAETFIIRQHVEGFNISDFNWSTASAATITLSFWVRSSLTGTFGGSLCNNAVNRSYPFSYTISAANTWEYKTITIVGDTGGTWLTNNGRGISVNWSLGTGSTYSGTAGSWSSSLYLSATGATSVVGTNGATFYITGVQLEKGSVATAFDYRPYNTELAMCQRYFESCFPIGTAPASNLGTMGGTLLAGASDGSSIYGFSSFKVPKRATPTMTLYNTSSSGSNFANGGTPLATTIDSNGIGYYTTTISGNRSPLNWAADSEL